MSWLDRILPAFTKRDYDRQYELGKTMGYILGYRQGCEDSAELERLKQPGLYLLKGGKQ